MCAQAVLGALVIALLSGMRSRFACFPRMVRKYGLLPHCSVATHTHTLDMTLIGTALRGLTEWLGKGRSA